MHILRLVPLRGLEGREERGYQHQCGETASPQDLLGTDPGEQIRLSLLPAVFTVVSQGQIHQEDQGPGSLLVPPGKSAS